jgi:hypothetical protein
MCRRDLGVRSEEFDEITLAEVEALNFRRMIGIRHRLYAAGVIAAAVWNSQIVEGRKVTPFDFVPGFEGVEDDIDREAVAQNVSCFMQAQVKLRNVTPDEAQAKEIE